MRFTKMHGIGNDYVYVDCFQEEVADPAAAAIKVSDRHFGIGSDGLILIKPSSVADCQMDMYNLDGSRGAMCGNGVRCVGKYVYDHGIVSSDKTSITVETLSGIKYLKLNVENGKVKTVTVDMGQPKTTSKIRETLTAEGKNYEFTGVSMGNPHAVLFLEGNNLNHLAAGPLLSSRIKRAGGLGDAILDTLNLESIGPRFEFHKRFPDRTNTEFIAVRDETHLQMRVWERGSGETLACGTGACASAVAAVLNGYAEKDKNITVSLLGGQLVIFWDSKTDHVFMTGEAEEVFQGEIKL